jgi:hypothetical protein
MRGLVDTRAGAGRSAGVAHALCAVLVAGALAAGRPAVAEEQPATAPVESSATKPAATRPWEVHAQTGLEYDSNVSISPSGQVIRGIGDPADGAVNMGIGGSVDIVDSDRAQVSLEYDLYQNLHFRLTDFNVRSNRIQGTGGLMLLPQLWLGAQAGFEHYALGGPGFSREPFVTPFISYTQGSWGLTQLLYRHGQATYLQEPFEGIRDGPTDVATLSQTIYWGTRYLTVGYEFGSERPTDSTGSAQAACVSDVSNNPGSRYCPGDFRFNYNQGFIGFGFTPGWRTSVDVTYVLRWERYAELNSLAGLRFDRAGLPLGTPFQYKRRDTINQVQVALRRPITTHFSAGVSYYGTFDNSNISFYQYTRHLVSAELRFSY